MSEEKENRKKRAAKRYVYQPAAQCEIENQILAIKLLNVSTSGIQFASRTKISTNKPVKIRWQEENVGELAPTCMLAREVHKPDNVDFFYFYGVQYYNLSQTTKDLLIALLRYLKSLEQEEVVKKNEKLNYPEMFEILDQGISFLKSALKGEKIPIYLEKPIIGISEYEKLAFESDDEVSRCIQKLTTYHFHCRCLTSLVDVSTSEKKIKHEYLQRIESLLENITKLEAEVDEICMENSADKSFSTQDRKSIQKKLNESNNRLFYSKVELLQTVSSAPESIYDSVELKHSVNLIKLELERIQEFTNPGLEQEPQAYKRRVNNAQELSRVEAIVDLPVNVEKKPRYFFWINIVFIFFSVVGFIFGSFSGLMERRSFQHEIAIPVKLIKYERRESQINITVSGEKWQHVQHVEKAATYKKIIEFLKKDHSIQTCIIINENGVILNSIFKNMRPEDVIE